jgi:hypothetical protein
VLAILAYCLTAFSSSFTCFFAVELMCVSALMRRFAALACNLALSIFVHRSETLFTSLISICHCFDIPSSLP